jgi:predicted acylesterase/phospholipase RssA
MELGHHFETYRPLEEMEVRLVREVVDRPGFISASEENTLRYALSFARLKTVTHLGHHTQVATAVAPFRNEMIRRLKSVLLESTSIRRELLVPHLKELGHRTREARLALLLRFAGELNGEALEREIREKALGLVLGGGGGTVYAYLGVIASLIQHGLRPRLIAGTSMGAILGLFCAALHPFDQETQFSIVRSLSWPKLFRGVSTEHRYGLPAALRLYLRACLSPWFGSEERHREPPRLSELPVKTIISVTGIRKGRLPRPISYYQRLGPFHTRSRFKASVASKWIFALSELLLRQDVLCNVSLGLDEGTHQFDALDAAGFSCALPGLIHYDVLREDEHMHQQLQRLFDLRGISRLIDGGLTSNVPAQAAWRAFDNGSAGTHNGFVFALNAFSVRWRTPQWLPLQAMAGTNTIRDRPFAHLMHDFVKAPSPLTIVPTAQELLSAIELGRKAIEPQLPFLRRMLTPLGAP